MTSLVSDDVVSLDVAWYQMVPRYHMKPNRNHATSPGDMWHPRETQKRSISINVRVTTEELEALRWMAGQLASDFGHQENPDVIRRALDLLHTKLRTKAPAPTPAATPAAPPPATVPAAAPAPTPPARTTPAPSPSKVAAPTEAEVRRKLKASKLSQAELGRLAGIDAAMLSRFKSGKKPLSPEKLARLAVALDR